MLQGYATQEQQPALHPVTTNLQILHLDREASSTVQLVETRSGNTAPDILADATNASFPTSNLTYDGKTARDARWTYPRNVVTTAISGVNADGRLIPRCKEVHVEANTRLHHDIVEQLKPQLAQHHTNRHLTKELNLLRHLHRRHLHLQQTRQYLYLHQDNLAQEIHSYYTAMDNLG